MKFDNFYYKLILIFRFKVSIFHFIDDLCLAIKQTSLEKDSFLCYKTIGLPS